MRIRELYDVVILKEGEETPPDAAKRANAFAKLVQCLGDRSLALVIREAKDDGRKALAVLREHYQGIGKPRIIELTSLQMREAESTHGLHNKGGNCSNLIDLSLKVVGEVI